MPVIQLNYIPHHAVIHRYIPNKVHAINGVAESKRGRGLNDNLN